MNTKQFLSSRLTWLALFCSAQLGLAQFPEVTCYHVDAGAHERNRNIDVEYMGLDVSFVPEKGEVKGLVLHRFKALQDQLDTVFFDAPGIQINKVSLDGQPIAFRTIPAGLVCETRLTGAFGQIHEIAIDYLAHPKRGIYFIGWNNDNSDDPKRMTRKQIWTQGQGIDNRHWIPMIDDRGDKFVTAVSVYGIDDRYKVLSNGALISNKLDKKTNTRTWVYKMSKPHAGYLLMLGIGEYNIKESKTSRGTPIQFWYYPEHPERVEPTSKNTEDIIEFLEDEIGVPYAWGNYANIMIQDFLYGAMENTSATTFGDFFWVDSRSFLDHNYIGVNCHEATHQWFGDLITGRHDAEQWLQESFATFYPGLYQGHAFGEDAQAWYFRGQMNGALAAGRENSLPVRHSASGSSRHYPKGASVLYMLQHTMGRENYRRAIQLYLQRHGYGTVETWDLQKAIIDATGMNMDWFFDEWIHRGGEPKYRVQFSQQGNQGVFNIEQIHVHDAVVRDFKMPIDFAIHLSDGRILRQTVVIDKAYQQVRINLPEGSEAVLGLFDEGSFVLKHLEFEKNQQHWLTQLAKATFTLDRFDALLAMKSWPLSAKKEALLAAYKREKQADFLAEITRQLMADDASALEFAQSAFESSEHLVRRVAINQCPITPETQAYFWNSLSDSSYENIELALRRMWNNPLFGQQKNALLDRIKGLDGYLNNLLIAYNELGAEIYPDINCHAQLVLMAGPQFEFRTRVQAVQALRRMNHLDEYYARVLFDALLNFNSRLSNPVLSICRQYIQETQKKSTFESALQKSGGDWPGLPKGMNALNAAEIAKLRGMLGL